MISLYFVAGNYLSITPRFRKIGFIINHSIRTSLHANSIRHIAACCLAGPNNLNHLPPFHSIVSRHWIVRLNAWELSIAKTVPLEKFLFLILG
jgi:hypothetical protein